LTTIFFIGELFFFQKKYEQSIAYYKKAVTACKKQEEKEKIFESMINSLSKIENHSENINLFLYTYEGFIELKLTSDLSLKIWQRLNNLYLSLNQVAKSRDLISKFAKTFPQDSTTKNSMITDLVGHLSANNSTLLSNIVTK
jgi:tetratricopeptide (TPR) repeat protein